ncbi:ABC transporter ATP-binding protein [Nakamurella sp. YIM 132084]|uniref:ABC transporter ATP-binding protein n=1 Tax=Nakamurella leprariae TaxID=2803911 RepID=A0A938YIB6_9ACTN|nr:ABC transporter ATP-binding protein [Nakamurella leprariae]
MPDEVLTVRDLVVSLGRGRARREVLHGASLTVRRGRIVALIGETGSGKTTLARTVLGLVSPDSGEIRVDGRLVSGLSGAELRTFRRSGQVQYVFQDPLQSLDPDLSVGDSIAEGLLARGEGNAAARTDAVADALRLVGLPVELASRLPGEISGGQRQRVTIARAMVLGPELVLLDEPVSALDAANRVQILDLLQRLRAERNVGMLFISHDLGSVAGISDEVAVLYRGEIVEVGTTRQVLTDPQHPYTQLLVGSAPTLHGEGLSRSERERLRALLPA